jgi:hypothetical protein
LFLQLHLFLGGGVIFFLQLHFFLLFNIARRSSFDLHPQFEDFEAVLEELLLELDEEDEDELDFLKMLSNNLIALLDPLQPHPALLLAELDELELELDELDEDELLLELELPKRLLNN